MGNVDINNSDESLSDIKNGELVVYTDGGAPWHISKNDVVTLNFDIVNHLRGGQTVQIGYILDGVYRDIYVEKVKGGISLEFAAPEDGDYNFYIVGASSAPIEVRAISVE